MPATSEEIAAANQLAAALLECILAVQRGVSARRQRETQPAPPTVADAVVLGRRDRRLLTVPQAAQALSISQRSLWRLVAANELTRVRLGRTVRIDSRDIDRCIDRSKS